MFYIRVTAVGKGHWDPNYCSLGSRPFPSLLLSRHSTEPTVHTNVVLQSPTLLAFWVFFASVDSFVHIHEVQIEASAFIKLYTIYQLAQSFLLQNSGQSFSLLTGTIAKAK